MAVLLLHLMTLSLCVTLTLAVIFTSSHKVSKLALNEDRLLAKLQEIVVEENDVILTQAYEKLLSESKHKSPTEVQAMMSHPNGFYLIIKRFALDYPAQLGHRIQGVLKTRMMEGLDPISMPNNDDLEGALEGLLRLQKIYSLSGRAMVQGNYSGHLGPALTLEDAFLLSQRAFSKGSLPESLDLLDVALELRAKGPSEAALMGLKGRALVLQGKDEEATQVFKLANQLDPLEGEVLTLAQHIKDRSRAKKTFESTMARNFSRLCQYDDGPYHIENPDYQAMRCRYKPTLLPYYTFKEEILATTPYVSLFYHVFSQSEKQHLLDKVDNKLERGVVGPEDDNFGIHHSRKRTSDVAFVEDDDPGTERLSQRVSHVTGMSVKQAHGTRHPTSAEGFQVVNYGLAGHYYVHLDAFPWNDESGNRLATFLVYLNTVEKGGNTVFTEAGISVAAREDTVLFWYNYSPAFNKIDQLTHHAGCPVLVGEKWIANKWIRSYGNAYHRPCGLSENAQQPDIEKVMNVHHRNIVNSGF